MQGKFQEDSDEKRKITEKSNRILIIEKITILLHELAEKRLFFIFNKVRAMTKAEIVNEVAKATGIEKITVQTVVEAFMESVKDSLAKGNPVYLRGFGSFII